MKGYNEEQDIERLLKEIQFENSRLQKALRDIKPLLREFKQVFQQIKKSIDQYDTGRRLFLRQLKKDGNRLEFNGINQEFQNVADATPTPNLLAPLTENQRILIREALTQLRRLQTLRQNLRNVVRTAALISLAGGGESIALLFTLIGEIERIRAEIEEVRDNLRDIFLSLLLEQ